MTIGIARADRQEKGINIWPFGFSTPIRSIEISNMELFNWAGAAVVVGDNTEGAIRGRLFNTNPGAVRVTAKLGFLLSAMKGMVEGEIQRVLKEKLG